MTVHVIPQRKGTKIPSVNWDKIINFVEEITRCRLITGITNAGRDLIPEFEYSYFEREIVSWGSLDFYHVGSDDGVRSVKIWHNDSGKKPVLVLWMWYDLPTAGVDYGCGRTQKQCANAIHVVLNVYNQKLPWQEALFEAQVHKDEILAEQKKRIEAYRRQQKEHERDDITIRRYYGAWRLGLGSKAKFHGEALLYNRSNKRVIT